MNFILSNKKFKYRFARASDLHLIFKFQRKVFSKLNNKGYILPLSKKEIIEYTSRNEKSNIYLVFYKDKLIAYATIWCPSNSQPEWLTDFKLPKTNLKATGELYGCIVYEKFRNFGLQNYLIDLRENYLIKNNYKFSIVTVDVNNKVSYNNLIKKKYKSIQIKDYKKVSIRYYMKKEL